MEMETILLISDESDAEESSSNRRRAEEQDPLSGKRNLRKKKPKIDNNEKKEPVASTSDKKDEEEVKPPPDPTELETDARYEILTTLEGACFQSRFPYDKMTTYEVVAFPEFTKKTTIEQRRIYLGVRNRILKM